MTQFEGPTRQEAAATSPHRHPCEARAIEARDHPIRDRLRIRLWARLRDRRTANLKFLRQVPVGPFIVDFAKRASVPIRTPAEEQKDFVLQPGYRMDLVLSDPDIQEPAAISFDGNGRMYVLELRGYMQDADAGQEKDPIGVKAKA